MSRVGRDILILLGWIGLAAVLTVVVGLVVAPALYPTPPVSYPCNAGNCGDSDAMFGIGNAAGPFGCTGVSAPKVGCVSEGGFAFNVTIESSTVTFDSVLFKVMEPGDRVYVAPGGAGVNILTRSGHSAASFNLTGGGPIAMEGAGNWTYSNASLPDSGSTPLTTSYSIVVDVGTANPAGLDLTLVAESAGSENWGSQSLAL
jgi:hypothetical protein